MIESEIFDFELDFAGTLRCIPMIVRFKLDQCGVKLSLRQWSKFSRDERDRLVNDRTHSARKIEAYRVFLVGLIEMRAKERAQSVPIETNADWCDQRQVPARVCGFAADAGVEPPTIEQWAALNSLERFALFKLTRPGHDNDNFLPAMREFELIA